MSPNTHDHPDYRMQFTGQAFELNFECASTDDVNERFGHIMANGGRSIADRAKFLTQLQRREWGANSSILNHPG